ncbi:hypothetical protein NXU95_16255 [Phocaeicola vulgatus]|nr:hypothetical protein [Phocaeicola vulgatus]
MLKDTKSLGNNKAPACESRGFVHKKKKVRILTHLRKVSNVTGERLYILQAIHIMDVCDCLASILQMSHEVTLSIK